MNSHPIFTLGGKPRQFNLHKHIMHDVKLINSNILNVLSNGKAVVERVKCVSAKSPERMHGKLNEGIKWVFQHPVRACRDGFDRPIKRRITPSVSISGIPFGVLQV